MLAIAIWAAVAAALSPGSSSAQSTQALSITNRRPVAAAVEAVEKLTGDVITYEDVEIVFAGDMDDITAELHHGQPHSRIMVAPRETVSVGYESGPDGTPTDVEGLVRSIAAERNDASLRFAMRQAGNHFFNVYATAARDVSGKLVDRTSLLDTFITLPVQERSAMELFEEMVKAVGAARQQELGLGGIAMNLLFQKRTNLGASNETARDFLVRALPEVSPQLSYSLFCQPEQGCMLNMHLVPLPPGRTPEPARHALPPPAPAHFPLFAR